MAFDQEVAFVAKVVQEAARKEILPRFGNNMEYDCRSHSINSIAFQPVEILPYIPLDLLEDRLTHHR